MKKLIFTISILAFVISGCTGAGTSGGSSTGSGTSSPVRTTIGGLFNSVPADLQAEVNSRIDPNSELGGFGSAASDKIGAAAGQMKALDNSKSDLRSKIKKEVQSNLNSYYDSLDAYTKTLVKAAMPDMITHATELSEYNIVQKGAWEDEKKVYALVSVNKSDVQTHSKDVFNTFLDNMAAKISDVKGKI